MLRRIFALLLTAALLAGLTGCSQTPEEDAAQAGGLEASLPAEPDSQPDPEPELPPEPEPPQPPEPTVATLTVCGDAMSHMPLTNDAWDEEQGVYDYGRIMAAAGPLVEAADYAVVNLETTLAGGPPYSGYPNFNSPDDMAYALRGLGFDLCLTANNHSLDKGYPGRARRGWSGPCGHQPHPGGGGQ